MDSPALAHKQLSFWGAHEWGDTVATASQPNGQGWSARSGRDPGKSGSHVYKPNTGREPPLRRRKWRGAQAVEKSLYVDLVGDPYRKPTLVGRGKYPEVDERSSVKELGKLTP